MTPPTGNAYGEFASRGGFGVRTFTLTAVPEASTWALMLIGLAGLGIAGYRASQKRAATWLSVRERRRRRRPSHAQILTRRSLGRAA
jgi:hypothetical protein